MTINIEFAANIPDAGLPFDIVNGRQFTQRMDLRCNQGTWELALLFRWRC